MQRALAQRALAQRALSMPSSSESSSSSSASRAASARERKEKKEKSARRKGAPSARRSGEDEKRDDPPGPSKAAGVRQRHCRRILRRRRRALHRPRRPRKHATIVKVHTGDVVPYFTVSVDGAEKADGALAPHEAEAEANIPHLEEPPPPVAPPATSTTWVGCSVLARRRRGRGPPREPPRRVLGAQRRGRGGRARALRNQRVWDPSLGVYRSVRLSGEVVEESVSRGEQQDHGGKAPRRAVGPPTAAQASRAARSLASTRGLVQVGVCLRG